MYACAGFSVWIINEVSSCCVASALSGDVNRVHDRPPQRPGQSLFDLSSISGLVQGLGSDGE